MSLLSIPNRVGRILMSVVSVPLIALLKLYINIMQHFLGSEVAGKMHHQLFRWTHLLVLRFAKFIVMIAPSSFVDSIVHRRNPAKFPGEGHEWEDATAHDSRSPCPVLNTLANHHFLPHDGRNIHPHQLIDALVKGVNCTRPLAWFLTYGGYLLLRQWGPISLGDLSRHSCIEHNASLARHDCKKDSEYAPTEIAQRLFRRLERDSSDGVGLTSQDIAAARVRREMESFEHCKVPLDAVHAEIARGEMALVLDIFGMPRAKDGEPEIDLNFLREWWCNERFPEGWAPHKRQSLLETIRTAGQIRASMRELEVRNVEAKKKALREKTNEVWRKDTDDLTDAFFQTLSPTTTHPPMTV